MPPKRRLRGGGTQTQQELVALLHAYFASPTKVGPYGPKLLAHRRLLQQLEVLQVNLSFNNTMMLSAFKETAIQKRHAWRFNAEDVERWSVDLTSRLRLMCKHVGQAKGKARRPAWMQGFQYGGTELSFKKDFHCKRGCESMSCFES